MDNINYQDVKNRILQLMESTHLNQQGFASFLGVSPATINGIFKDRSKTTLIIVDAIKNKFPGLSLEWLLYGNGDMYSSGAKTNSASANPISQVSETAAPLPSRDDSASSQANKDVTPTLQFDETAQGVEDTIKKTEKIITKYIDKKQRVITEIRVFYDDQTWESFVPKR